jgi:hypothetical protein
MNGLEMAYQELTKAGDALSYMAQTSGGTAGPDYDLMTAINKWSKAKDKVRQLRRIERFEPGQGVAVSAGRELSRHE